MTNELASVGTTRKVGVAVAVILLCIGLSPLNCNDGEPPTEVISAALSAGGLMTGDAPTEVERDALRTLGRDVFLATHREFVAETRNLERVTAILDAEPTDANREEAQLARPDVTEDLNHDPHSLVSSIIDPLGAATLRTVHRVRSAYHRVE